MKRKLVIGIVAGSVFLTTIVYTFLKGEFGRGVLWTLLGILLFGIAIKGLKILADRRRGETHE